MTPDTAAVHSTDIDSLALRKQKKKISHGHLRSVVRELIPFVALSAGEG